MVRKSEHMFEKVNLTPVSIKVLTYLARSPDKEFYLRELANIIGSSVGGCHKVLNRLCEMNLIKKRKSGRNQYYKINDQNQALKYFKIFINIQELSDFVSFIKEKSKKIILFGSCATGEDTIKSDIDLLIISENVEDIKDMIDIRYLNQRLLKPIILFPHEVIQLKNSDKAFYEEIQKGIALWRDKDE